MENIKIIFKILIVMQIFLSVFASSEQNHNAEAIDAARRRGMDGDAVAELLRTMRPVVRTVELPNGVTKTTTYNLENDGTISSKTITETKINRSAFGLANWAGFDFSISKPLPNIHDIYKSQTDEKSNTNPIYLNIEDIPITDIFIDGKPAGENIYLRD